MVRQVTKDLHRMRAIPGTLATTVTWAVLMIGQKRR